HVSRARVISVSYLAPPLLATDEVEVTVASFDPTHVRGVVETRAARARRAEELIGPPLARVEAVNRPRSWAVAGIPVARLPAFLDGDRRRPGQVVDAHAAPLMAFGRGLHGRHPIDLVHAHTGLPDGVAAARLADALDVPIITTEHASTTSDELVEDEARQLYGRLLTPPRQLVAVSRALAHDVARALGVVDDSIGVIPNAVPVEGFPL